MAYIMLPQQERTRTGGETFSEGASQYLQMAFQAMLQRKMADMQRQRNLEQARQVAPQLFAETTPASAYQKYLPQGTELNLAGGLAPERQTQVARQLTQAKGIQIPERVRKFAFKSEGLQPSIDITTGQVSLKPEDAFQAYYKSLLPTKTAGEKPTQIKQDNIIYRDTTGTEIPAEQAQADIASGNTNYFLSRKEFTKSGIKETPLAKPEDLEKSKIIKQKSEFVISQAQDGLDTIAEVEKGIGYFGAFGQYIPKEVMPGTPYYTWRTNIDKLLAGKMINLMTQMKEASKTGATGFGQLSEKEGQILREASTALKRGLPPDKAQEYLNNMKTILQKVVEGNLTQDNQQPQGQTDFSDTSTEELLRRRQQLLQGGGQ